MAPDQRGEVGDVVVADVYAVRPDLTNGLLHVDGVPMHDGIKSEARDPSCSSWPCWSGLLISPRSPW